MNEWFSKMLTLIHVTCNTVVKKSSFTYESSLKNSFALFFSKLYSKLEMKLKLEFNLNLKFKVKTSDKF